jgi:hypothetical protein
VPSTKGSKFAGRIHKTLVGSDTLLNFDLSTNGMHRDSLGTTILPWHQEHVGPWLPYGSGLEARARWSAMKMKSTTLDPSQQAYTVSKMLSSIWRTLRKMAHHLDVDALKLAGPVREMILRNWYLGFTFFGGPAVHFQIASTVAPY